MKLLCAAIAFVGGTLVGAPAGALALFAAAGLVGVVLLARLRVSALPAVMMLAFALGGARVAVGDDAPLTAYAGPRVQQVEGIVVSDVDGYGDFSRFRLRVERVRSSGVEGANSADSADWTDANGTLLVSARADAKIAKQRDAPYFRYGDRLLLRGRISEPPQLDDFDYAAYLARQGISEVMDARSVTLVGEGEGSAFYRSLYDVRRRLAQSIAAVVPEPQAALSQATLLGLRRSMPSDLTEDFRRSGAAHLLAISGLHVGILLSVSLSAGAAILGRKWHLHLIAPLLVIWLYGLLAGMSPSATRACIMGSVYLAALAFGRQRGSLAPIGFAAALMVAVSPSVLYSISFQLSFAAIAGIASVLRRARRGDMVADSTIDGTIDGTTARQIAALAIAVARAGSRTHGLAWRIYRGDNRIVAAHCAALRARVHDGHTGVGADAARTAAAHNGQRRRGNHRAGKHNARNAVWLARLGRRSIPVGRGDDACRITGRFG